MTFFPSALFLLSGVITGVRGHALWQQTVRSPDTKNGNDNGHSLAALFTFAEKPGIAHVEREFMSKKEYDAGMKLFMRSNTHDEYESLTQIKVDLEGKFIVAPLPDGMTGGSYVLESNVRSGLWAEGDAAPSLILFYTSASHSTGRHGGSEAPIPTGASANRFRFGMSIVEDKTKCSDLDEDLQADYYCVLAASTYDGSFLPDHDIKIIDGTSGEDIETKKTDSIGEAYFVVSSTLERVFAKVKHVVDTPGAQTSEGEKYDTVSNIATTVLELSTYESSPLPDYNGAPETTTTMASQRVFEVNENADEHQMEEEVGLFKETKSLTTGSLSALSYLLVGVTVLTGSFFGGLLSTKFLTCRLGQTYTVAPVQDDNIDLSNAPVV